MSIRSITLSVCLLTCAASTLANTNQSYHYLLTHGLRIDGNAPAQITLANHQKKIVRLMNIALSPEASQKLADNAAYILQHPTQSNLLQSSGLPASKYIGMNGIPVLDQGSWGTCATFSSTAAIDALFPLLQDSQISQLCNLELGVTLNNGGDGGWQGSLGYVVLGQIAQYGYINKQYQHASGCGGLTQYPIQGYDNGSGMSIDDFNQHSSKNFTAKDWTPIVTYNGKFAPMKPVVARKALLNIKKALNHGYRVVFGTLIDPNIGQVGAAGAYHNIDNVAWVMTKQMHKDIAMNQSMEGHEIIIDGYDNKACATRTTQSGDKAKQCGLLRIRNSWSDSAGDKGDYYMSYDYFKGMAIEAYAVGLDVKDKFKPAK